MALVIGSLDRGGAERTLAELAKAFVDVGDVVTLVTIAGERGDDIALDPRVERVALGLDHRSSGLPSALLWSARRVWSLRRWLRRERPDAVLSFIDTTNLLTLLAARPTRIPVVVSERVDPRYHPVPALWSWLRRRLYPRAAGVVVQTEAVRPWAETLNRRVHVIPNFPLVGEAPTEPPTSPPLRVVGMGRLVAQKGFDLLVGAFARCALDHPDWVLDLYGDGPERNDLEALAAGLGVGQRVTLHGRTDDPEGVLARAALFVLSSRYEGFPNVLVEAMALGTPVVTTDCPSGPSLIVRHGVDGLVVPPEDRDALAGALDLVMGDHDLRMALAARAPDVKERYPRPAIVRQWHELLRKAAAGTEGRGR